MTSIVLVESTGILKSLKAKDLTTDTLYKKCGFRNDDHFSKRTTWTTKVKGVVDDITVSLWAKDVGKANYENKYDLPPPVDKVLYYGPCTLVRTKGDTIVDLPLELWKKVYNKLFGGFHDLQKAEADDDDVDELASVPAKKKTAHGYLKDGFVVDAADAAEGANGAKGANAANGAEGAEGAEGTETSDADTSEDKEEEEDEDDIEEVDEDDVDEVDEDEEEDNLAEEEEEEEEDEDVEMDGGGGGEEDDENKVVKKAARKKNNHQKGQKPAKRARLVPVVPLLAAAAAAAATVKAKKPVVGGRQKKASGAAAASASAATPAIRRVAVANSSELKTEQYLCSDEE